MKRIANLMRWLTVARFQLQNRYRYYVYSVEPFSPEPVVRGPFCRQDAMRLMAVNGACGSIDRLYEDIGAIQSPVSL